MTTDEVSVSIEAAQRALGHSFADPSLLVRALTHASIAEQRALSNERMEFLGDSVLGLIASERIYQRYPDLLEGEMTKIKSTAVSRQTCAMIARSLGLDELLVTGKGMQGADAMPQSLAAAVLEAVIAAIYLDGGYAAAEKFIGPLVDPVIERAAISGHQENFKSVLQQHAQQAGLDTPAYRILDEKGPDHAKCFKVCVEIGGRKFNSSWGQSKKQAEQAAALNALSELGLVEQTSDGHVKVAIARAPQTNGGNGDGNAGVPSSGK
jgi:ribonuclease-3